MWTRLHQFFVRRTDKVVDVYEGAGSARTAQPGVNRHKWRIRRIFLASGLVVLIFCSSIYGFNEAALYVAKRQLEDTQRRSELLRPMREKKFQVDAMLSVINQKQTILSTLTRDSLSCYVIMSELTVKAPPQLRLTEIEFEKGLLKVGGTAPDQADLALFKKRLEQGIILAEPVLVKNGQDTAQGADRFQMTVKIKEGKR